MSDGTLSIRRRQAKGKETEVSPLDSLNLIHVGEGAVSKQRGGKAIGDVGEIRVSENKKQKKLKAYDRFLKGFKYSAALDSVLGTVRAINHCQGPPLLNTTTVERTAGRHICSHQRAHSPRWPENRAFRER